MANRLISFITVLWVLLALPMSLYAQDNQRTYRDDNLTFDYPDTWEITDRTNPIVLQYNGTTLSIYYGETLPPEPAETRTALPEITLDDETTLTVEAIVQDEQPVTVYYPSYDDTFERGEITLSLVIENPAGIPETDLQSVEILLNSMAQVDRGTPETADYMVWGYLASAVIIAGMIGIIWLRSQSLKRDEALLQQLEKEAN